MPEQKKKKKKKNSEPITALCTCLKAKKQDTIFFFFFCDGRQGEARALRRSSSRNEVYQRSSCKTTGWDTTIAFTSQKKKTRSVYINAPISEVQRPSMKKK